MTKKLVVRVKQTENAFLVHEVLELISHCGNSGVILSGCGSAISEKTINRIDYQLKGCGCAKILRYSGILSGCKLSQAYKICKSISEMSTDVDWILAIGGGAVIDMGKIVRDILSPRTDIFIEQSQFMRTFNKSIHLLCVPTSIGSAAEISSVVSFFATETKISVRHDAFFPTTAIIVPSAYRSLDKYQIETGIFDAISHSLDPIVSNPQYSDIDVSYATSIIKYLLARLSDLKNIQNVSDDILLSIVNATHILATEGDGRPSTISLLHRIEHCVTKHTNLTHGAAMFHLFQAYMRRSSGNNMASQVFKELFSVDILEEKVGIEHFVRMLSSHFPELSKSELWFETPNINEIADAVIRCFGRQGVIETVPPTTIEEVEEILANSHIFMPPKNSVGNNLKSNMKKIFGGVSNIRPVVFITPIWAVFETVYEICRPNETAPSAGWFKMDNIDFDGFEFTLVHAGPYSQSLIDCLYFMDEFDEKVRKVIFSGLCGITGDSRQIGRVVAPDICSSYSQGLNIILSDNIAFKKVSSTLCLSFDTLHQERMALLKERKIDEGIYIDLELFHVAKWAKDRNAKVFAFLGVTDDVYQKPLWTTGNPISNTIIQKLSTESLSAVTQEVCSYGE